MCPRDGVDVKEPDEVRGIEDLVAGDLAIDDLAEETGYVGGRGGGGELWRA